jgi:hypothetical protein
VGEEGKKEKMGRRRGEGDGKLVQKESAGKDYRKCAE